MKNVITKTALIVSLTLGSIGASFAQGIPVYDNAQVVLEQQNFMKQMVEVANQLETARNQWETAKNQLSSFQAEALEMKKRMEGVTGFVDGFSSGDLDKILNLMDSIDASYIDDFMASNNLKFDDEQMRKNFTRDAELHAKYDALSQSLKEKDEEINKLRQRFASANTPQQREEISNSIALENSKMDNVRKTAEYELKKSEIEAKAQKDAEYNDYMSTKFGGY